MYEFRIQRMSDSDACSLSLIAGIAMFTIVVSNRIMKKPRHRMDSTSHGLCLRSACSAGAVIGELPLVRPQRIQDLPRRTPDREEPTDRSAPPPFPRPGLRPAQPP